MRIAQRAELFGVDPDALDRQADHRPIATRVPRGDAQARRPRRGEHRVAGPVRGQLISHDEQGVWAELYSRRLTFGGEPALLTVARDITSNT